MNKTISLNGPGSECIPGEYLVAMEIRRLAREQGKPVTAQESRGDRWLTKVGLVLAGCLGLYMAIHIIVAIAR